MCGQRLHANLRCLLLVKMCVCMVLKLRCAYDCFQYVLEIGGFGDADGEFVNPAGMALDSSGNLWVCDRENHRMQMFDIPLQGVTAER